MTILENKTGKQPEDTKHIFDVDSPECQDIIQKVVNALGGELNTIDKLSLLYEEHPFLNDIQPESMGEIHLASLDELSCMIGGCLGEWEDLLTK